MDDFLGWIDRALALRLWIEHVKVGSPLGKIHLLSLPLLKFSRPLD